MAGQIRRGREIVESLELALADANARLTSGPNYRAPSPVNLPPPPSAEEAEADIYASVAPRARRPLALTMESFSAATPEFISQETPVPL